MNITIFNAISIFCILASLVSLIYLGLREFIFLKDTKNTNKKEESRNNNECFEYKIIYHNKIYDTTKSELIFSSKDFDGIGFAKDLYYKSPNNNFFKVKIRGSDINFYTVDDFEMKDVLATHPEIYMKVFSDEDIEEA